MIGRTASLSVLLLSIAAVAHAQQDELGHQPDEIAGLIEALVSPNSPPTPEWGAKSTERPASWDPAAQDRVRAARARLSNLGKRAFPQLMEYLEDDRYSMTALYAEPVNLDVGSVCRQIITNKVEFIGMRYKARQGSDGKSHGCPSYFAHRYRNDLSKWWQENKQKTLLDMQLDTLTWRIAQEARIGFTSQQQWRQIMGELFEELDRLEDRRAASVSLAASPEQEARIRQLIDQLVFAPNSATNQPVLSPGIRDDSEEYRQRFQRCRQAFAELTKLKDLAFPLLVEHLDDQRQSINFRNHVADNSVGSACYHILYFQLQDRPPGYSRYGYMRLGRDGQRHVQPYWSGTPFDEVGVKQWLADNQHLNYAEKQIKCLNWLLAEEKKIGAADAESYFINILPLEIQILKRRQENGEDVANELRRLREIKEKKIIDEVPSELLPNQAASTSLPAE